MSLLSILDAAHEYVAEVVGEGDVVVDATVGNGHDTAFLAKQVGAEGQVIGFDVQPEAIQRTRERLEAEGEPAGLTLVEGGHEDMAAHVPEAVHGRVAAVTFNLGYLPGGDKEIVTQPATTVPALNAAAELLRPGGRISVVLYTGHPGGDAEAEAVNRWAAALDQAHFDALSYTFSNHTNDPPRLLVVEKSDE
jgi:predicted methyltransferase